MKLSFSGPIWFWRGPAPFHFVTVPEPEAAALRSVAAAVTYGWGMIPVRVRIGDTETTTSLWPKNGGYIVPIKKKLQDAEELDVDDVVAITLTVEA